MGGRGLLNQAATARSQGRACSGVAGTANLTVPLCYRPIFLNLNSLLSNIAGHKPPSTCLVLKSSSEGSVQQSSRRYDHSYIRQRLKKKNLNFGATSIAGSDVVFSASTKTSAVVMMSSSVPLRLTSNSRAIPQSQST